VVGSAALLRGLKTVHTVFATRKEGFALMPRLLDGVPRYRKHRASGQAIVNLSGKDFYLGPHGTKVSHQEYDRVVAEWLARIIHACGNEMASGCI